ncbi:uncharacterized protein LOC110267251 [Arachis ipaensis]|uniref:uncharacterized protein LOC110267251 n=1 Tax=Arachis ipaensis TaxID=130454 RepID=UPI000A2B3A57|nr:uncharacterized protein LOC110267251 [Arachis ipaensis]
MLWIGWIRTSFLLKSTCSRWFGVLQFRWYHLNVSSGMLPIDLGDSLVWFRDYLEEFDEDEESRNDGHARTPDETSKGYNLRIDPPRRSASRYTPSVFKKAAKKCKNLVKDVKWAMRK